jgi:hypothetical protein
VTETVDPEHTGAPTTATTVIDCACKVDCDNKINKKSEKLICNLFPLFEKKKRPDKMFLLSNFIDRGWYFIYSKSFDS